jgi:outer membrane protein assembly factor BamB
MTFRKCGGILFSALCSFLPAVPAKAQCFSGDNFAVCPPKDTIYLVNDTSLGALSLSKKEMKWQIELPGERNESFLGPVATPDVVVIYAGFPDTRIYAFDTDKGHSLWHLETSSRNVSSFGSYLFMNEPNFWDGLAALDGKTGKAVWQHPAKPARATRPAAPDRVWLTDSHAIDADTGRVLQDWPKGWNVSATALAGAIRAIGTRDGRLAAFSGAGNEMRWSRQDSKKRLVAGLDGDENNLLVAWYGATADYDLYHREFYRPGHVTLQLLAAASGAIRWSKEIDCNSVLPSPAALVGGQAIFVKGESLKSGVVEMFDTATGKQKWIAHIDRRLTDGPACQGRSCFMGSDTHEVLRVDTSSGSQTWYGLPKE